MLKLLKTVAQILNRPVVATCSFGEQLGAVASQAVADMTLSGPFSPLKIPKKGPLNALVKWPDSGIQRSDVDNQAT